MKRTLTGVDKIGSGYGDGAYDQMQCYEEFSHRGGKPIIPPRKGSRDDKVVWTIAEQLRDIKIKASRDLGRSARKIGVGYHRRSLVETAMGRCKNQLTCSLASRILRNEKSEMEVKIFILNRMTELGMPIMQTAKSLPKNLNLACWRNASDTRLAE